jgi:lipopolysaccharide export system protein LptA
MRFVHFAVAFLVFGLLSGGICLAEPSKAEVIRIRSDRLEANEQERQVTFLGNVVAKQGDFNIEGDRMTIFYSGGDGAEVAGDDLNQRLDRIVVEGNVRISPKKNTIVTAKHAVYDVSENKIVLTGEPRVQRDSDFIEGSSITYFPESGKSIVEGGPSGPVEATIYGVETVDSSGESSGERARGSGTDSDEGG